jgi:glycosyltransferase involved in cell wall biosynthesis
LQLLIFSSLSILFVDILRGHGLQIRAIEPKGHIRAIGVVFTGAEQEFIAHYNLTERVAVNALPDVDSLVTELSHLIKNPQEIIEIGKRARAFIEREHDYITIAKKYLEVWKKN